MDAALEIIWDQFKAAHPKGSQITGTIKHVAHFGVSVDLGVPFNAVLLVPYIRPHPEKYPEDYPQLGGQIIAFIRHYGDELEAGGKGIIALTQIQ